MSGENSKANDLELTEWIDSLQWVIDNEGNERAKQLVKELHVELRKSGIDEHFQRVTPYINTIPPHKQLPYPGSREIERRIRSLVRWNAMAMVHRANSETGSTEYGSGGVGGHISTFASAATLWEVGFNHFFRNKTDNYGGDVIFFQGHASPGVYSRAYLEGRLTEKHLSNFRRELADGGGLSSYPHPWLMPDFWQYPTVSMGLGPMMAIYQARFQRYLENRGLKPKDGGKIVSFIGDGESDEPETLGAINLAVRENLDNLIFIVNCNLQRLDGPVRGNGKIIQELEGSFRGSGWNVIKVIWGSNWDELLEKDTTGLLIKLMEETVDGEYQKLAICSGDHIRKEFFGKYPELLELVKNMSDEEITKLTRGGHDPDKVYNAYKAAWDCEGKPSVILAKTIKGYGLGETAEGKNPTHNTKKMNEAELYEFRSRFGIPIP
ncbi:MAG: pyruvate dehydrogenase (acetyl-transferring), homodimeric type, partial [Lentisphaeria bacterium]|nr:pyruvate dehydrogenase (acetyl-transferring), homodimeric type [Lentisphaeria bacterium]NQZ70464.1 pyruvate dehydrogenase (acetyl-transferring), homodimeric type [Lentisphaeria bacterium]